MIKKKELKPKKGSALNISTKNLKHLITSRKVAGSIPDEDIGFFNLPNPSSSTVALGFT
jgi:hypothetical protein